jgi:chemotaxis protein MotB
LFPSGKAKLSREGRGALAQVAGVLAEIKERSFQVAGHTDNVPIRNNRFKSNWSLSSARAVAVVQHLIKNGVTSTNLSAAGYGDTQPVASNDTKEGRAQNRRIEIVLQPNLDELPDLSALENMI